MQIANYLSERRFEVFRYDKRGVGTDLTIRDAKHLGTYHGTSTINDVNALNTLIQQRDVDPKHMSMIGHSEGTVIVPKAGIVNLSNVRNLIMMGIVAR